MKYFMYCILLFNVSCTSLKISNCAGSKSDLKELRNSISEEIEKYYTKEYSENVVRKYLHAACITDTTIEVVVLTNQNARGYFVLDKNAKIISVRHELPEVY